MKKTMMKWVAAAATIGTVAMLYVPVAQANWWNGGGWQNPPTSVPEPATLGLLALSLVGLGLVKRKK